MAGDRTPGPWQTDGAEVYSGEGCSTVWVADAGPIEPITAETAEANARLIAAAPDLLEVCSDWINYICTDGEGDDADEEKMLDAMRAAVARATGAA